jgi:hypothetical protein
MAPQIKANDIALEVFSQNNQASPSAINHINTKYFQGF